MRLQSDQRLVGLVRDGHEPAFEAIVKRYRQPLVRYSARIAGPDRAEDVVQQTLINAHTALHRDDRPIDLKPWLYRIAHNLALNELRRHGPDHAPLPEDFDGVPQPPDLIEQREQFQRLVRAIQALPERQRNPLTRHVLEGRSYADVADDLGHTEGVVRGLIARARAQLRDVGGSLIPPAALSWIA